MKTPVPIYQLKRKARQLSRRDDIPLHAALDRMAVEEGYASWSLLSARIPATTTAAMLFARLIPGDLLLIGARPGHGKTLLGLELAVEAMKSGNRSLFFTLEYTEKNISDRFETIGVERSRFNGLFEFDCSDAISAGYIEQRLAREQRGTLVVIDYLQLLDQKRANPELGAQIGSLKSFARDQGVIVVIISQIDRSYDPSRKPVPDLSDVRLPNPLDLTLFNKTCFLNDGKVAFQAAG